MTKFDNITLGGKGNNSFIRSTDIDKTLYVNSLGNLKLGSNGEITIENSGTYASDGTSLETATQSFITKFIGNSFGDQMMSLNILPN